MSALQSFMVDFLLANEMESPIIIDDNARIPHAQPEVEVSDSRDSVLCHKHLVSESKASTMLCFEKDDASCISQITTSTVSTASTSSTASSGSSGSRWDNGSGDSSMSNSRSPVRKKRSHRPRKDTKDEPSNLFLKNKSLSPKTYRYGVLDAVIEDRYGCERQQPQQRQYFRSKTPIWARASRTSEMTSQRVNDILDTAIMEFSRDF